MKASLLAPESTETEDTTESEDAEGELSEAVVETPVKEVRISPTFVPDSVVQEEYDKLIADEMVGVGIDASPMFVTDLV